jgi:hypothetical protein
LAHAAGFGQLLAERLSIESAHAGCLVAGMLAGADSVDDRDLLRAGGASKLFEGIHAPSTLGT